MLDRFFVLFSPVIQSNIAGYRFRYPRKNGGCNLFIQQQIIIFAIGLWHTTEYKTINTLLI